MNKLLFLLLLLFLVSCEVPDYFVNCNDVDCIQVRSKNCDSSIFDSSRNINLSGLLIDFYVHTEIDYYADNCTVKIEYYDLKINLSKKLNESLFLKPEEFNSFIAKKDHLVTNITSMPYSCEGFNNSISNFFLDFSEILENKSLTSLDLKVENYTGMTCQGNFLDLNDIVDLFE